MEKKLPTWKPIKMGDSLPCQSFLRKKDGEILKLSTGAGIKVGQDAYYLPVDDVIEEIRNYPIEESKDEKMRRELVERFSHIKGFDWYGLPIKDILAWLEKQGSEQYSQCKSELENVIKCLINGMRFYYEDNEEATWGTDKWSMPVKHIIEVLEKQSEQKHQYNSRPRYIGEEELLGKKESVDWSKDDEENLYHIDALIKDSSLEVRRQEYLSNWLKSLRPQSQWKPSEEQIVALKHASNDCSIAFADMKILATLYEQLKALHHYEQDT